MSLEREARPFSRNPQLREQMKTAKQTHEKNANNTDTIYIYKLAFTTCRWREVFDSVSMPGSTLQTCIDALFRSRSERYDLFAFVLTSELHHGSWNSHYNEYG